jgi:ubiquinone/menaquinone biosynthesis C-methylase UbiE
MTAQSWSADHSVVVRASETVNVTTPYVLGSSSAELQRLGFQGKILAPITERLFRRAGINRGAHLLDLGCGAGDVSLLAAEIVGPTGSVIGIDRSAAAIGEAKKRAHEAAYKNVEFQVCEAEDFRSSESFDAVVGRYVLMFQADPAKFIQASLRHLRPRGVVAFHEISVYRSHHSLPSTKAWEDMVRIVKTTFQKHASSWDAGGRLVEHFQNAGLPCPELFAELPIGGGEHTPIYHWLAETVRSILPSVVEEGIATEADISIDTLEERLRTSAVTSKAQVEVAPQICAWSRLL